MNPLSGLGGFNSGEFRSLAASLQQAAAAAPQGDLSKLGPVQSPAITPESGVSEVGGEGAFSSRLGQFVREVNDKQNHAASSVSGLLAGDGVTLHQAMVSMVEANVSFQLMVEVRNKLLESYQELMRMQV